MRDIIIALGAGVTSLIANFIIRYMDKIYFKNHDKEKVNNIYDLLKLSVFPILFVLFYVFIKLYK